MSRGRRRDDSQVDSDYEADMACERRRGCSPSPSPDAQARIAKKPRAGRSSPDGTSEEEERRRRRLLANRRSAQRSRVKRLEEVGVLENLVDDLTKEVDELKAEIGCWTSRHRELLNEQQKLNDLLKAAEESEPGGATLSNQPHGPPEDWRPLSMPPQHPHPHPHPRPPQSQPQQPSPSQPQQLQPMAHTQQTHPQQQHSQQHPPQQHPNQQPLLRHPGLRQQQQQQQLPPWGPSRQGCDALFGGSRVLQEPQPHTQRDLWQRPFSPASPRSGAPSEGKEYLGTTGFSHLNQPGGSAGDDAVASVGAKSPTDMMSYSPHGATGVDCATAKMNNNLAMRRDSTTGNTTCGGSGSGGGGAGGAGAPVGCKATVFSMKPEHEAEGGSGTSSPHIGRPVASDPPNTPGTTQLYGESASASAGQMPCHSDMPYNSQQLLQQGDARGVQSGSAAGPGVGGGSGVMAAAAATAAAAAAPQPSMAPGIPPIQLMPHQHQHLHRQLPNHHLPQRRYHPHRLNPPPPDAPQPHPELPGAMSAPHPLESYDRTFHDRHSEAGKRTASDNCMGVGAVAAQLGRRTDPLDGQLSACVQPCGLGYAHGPGFNHGPDPSHAVHRTASPGDSFAAGGGFRGWGIAFGSSSPSFESKGSLAQAEVPTAGKPTSHGGHAPHRSSGGGVGAAAAALVHHTVPGVGVGVSLDPHYHPHLRHRQSGAQPCGATPQPRSGQTLHPYHTLVSTAASAGATAAGPSTAAASGPAVSAGKPSPHRSPATAAAAGAAASAATATTTAPAASPACDGSGSSTPPYGQQYHQQVRHVPYGGDPTTDGASSGAALASPVGGGGAQSPPPAPMLTGPPAQGAIVPHTDSRPLPTQLSGGDCDMEPQRQPHEHASLGPAAAIVAITTATASADSTCSNNSNRHRSVSSDSGRSLTYAQETAALRPVKSQPLPPMQQLQLLQHQQHHQQHHQQQQQQQHQSDVLGVVGMGLGLHPECPSFGDFSDHAAMVDYQGAAGSPLLDGWDLL